MKKAMWLRLRCDECGEYELITNPIKRMPTSCHYCSRPVELVACASGETMRTLPQMTKPRPAAAGLDVPRVWKPRRKSNKNRIAGKRVAQRTGDLRMVKR